MPEIFPRIRATVVLLAAFILLFGVVYPLVGRGLIENGFAAQMAGSLFRDRSGRVVGSSLDEPGLDRANYFWGRIYSPATVKCAADAGAAVCTDAIRRREIALTGGTDGGIPDDLLAFAASPLHPEIDLNAAEYQVPRIARIRGISEARLRTLIDRSTHNDIYNPMAKVSVNVTELNLRLDGKLT